MRRKLGLIRVEGRSGSRLDREARSVDVEGGRRSGLATRRGGSAASAIAFFFILAWDAAQSKSKCRIYHLQSDLKAKQPSMSVRSIAVLQLCFIIAASGRLFGSVFSNKGRQRNALPARRRLA